MYVNYNTYHSNCALFSIFNCKLFSNSVAYSFFFKKRNEFSFSRIHKLKWTNKDYIYIFLPRKEREKSMISEVRGFFYLSPSSSSSPSPTIITTIVSTVIMIILNMISSWIKSVWTKFCIVFFSLYSIFF